MNQEQLQKDFLELYIGRNPGQMVKEYYQKKRREMFLLVLAAIVLVLFCVINDKKNSRLEEKNIIFRSEMQEEEISLQMKNHGKEWEDIRIKLYPREYLDEELEELFEKVSRILPDLILKEGDTLNQVTSDLNLMEEIEGYPFLIRWESSSTDVIDEKGHLLIEDEGYTGTVNLKAIFTYENWKKEKEISVYVMVSKIEDYSRLLEKKLEEKERDTRKSKEFYLPESFDGQTLQWRYPPQNSAILLSILFLVFIPVIAWQKDREIHILAMRRKEQLQEEFPQFIAKIILLLEAGISTRNTIFYIAEDYQKKTYKEKNYLQEELNYVCRKMKNGLSEKEGYELLAKRCNLSCYKKLSGMMIQHLQKGGNSILYELRNESLKAGEEEKRRMQKKGEEMGTKLLFPMMLMLGIVMIFIMVPALFSFQV